MSGRLGKAMVERSHAAACDVGNDSIKDFAVLFVLVESFVKQVPEESTALRGSECVGAVDSDFVLEAVKSIRFIFEAGDKIPGRGEAQSHDPGIASCIDQVVELTRDEAIGIAYRRTTVRHAVERPGRSIQRVMRIVRFFADS